MTQFLDTDAPVVRTHHSLGDVVDHLIPRHCGPQWVVDHAHELTDAALHKAYLTVMLVSPTPAQFQILREYINDDIKGCQARLSISARKAAQVMMAATKSRAVTNSA